MCVIWIPTDFVQECDGEMSECKSIGVTLAFLPP